MVSLIENSTLVKTALSMGAVQLPDELERIVEFVSAQKPINIMEIGAEAGGTFFVWCQLASGIKISVDWPAGSSGSWKYIDHLALQERTDKMMSWSEGVCVITGDSHSREVHSQVGAILKDKVLDFLFIDGDHSYEGVSGDYRMYSKFVRPGGFIALHDIKDTPYHRRMGCDVARFWKELSGDKQEFCTDVDWGGIGLVRN